MVEIACIWCGKIQNFNEDSYEANGVFNAFCSDKDSSCEDKYAWFGCSEKEYKNSETYKGEKDFNDDIDMIEILR